MANTSSSVNNNNNNNNINNNKRKTLTSVEQFELTQWLEDHQANSSNLRRSFTDVLPLARLLSRYYPELIDLNYYPPRNSVHNKLCNWEVFNRRVLSRLGVRLSREQMVRVASCVPGSVDMLLFTIMRAQQAAERKARDLKDSAEEALEAMDEEADEAEDEQDEQVGKSEPELVKSDGPAAPATADERETKRGLSSRSLAKLAGNLGRTAIGMHAQQREGSVEPAALRRRGPAEQHPTGNQRGELLSELHEPRMVLYSVYMQAVNQLQQKNAKIGRFNQWCAHLENMLQLKCETIDELQQQVTRASKRLRTIRNPLRHNQQQQQQHQQRKSQRRATK